MLGTRDGSERDTVSTLEEPLSNEVSLMSEEKVLIAQEQYAMGTQGHPP